MDPQQTDLQRLQHLSNEVLNNLEQLMQAIHKVQDAGLHQCTKKWKHDKGVPNLIKTLVKVDTIISSNFPHSHNHSRIHSSPDQDQENEFDISRSRQKTKQIQNCLQSLQNQSILTENKRRHHNNVPISENSKIVGTDVIPQQPIKNADQNDESDGEMEENRQRVQYENPIARMIVSKKENDGQKSYVRGPYKSYTRELKERVVAMHEQEGFSISRISKSFDIPIKNIKRWCEQGIDRKEGAGRKRLDPQMQNELYRRIMGEHPNGGRLNVEEVRKIALQLSTIADFKASRGWVINFADRYRLNDIFTLY